MEFIDPEWRDVLQQQGLGDFDAIWDSELKLVDSPNRARGGWSEVAYIRLPEAVDGVEGLYIKRQQDFGFRQWANPFKKLPTYYREYKNLLACISHGLPAVQPVAFGMRHHDGHQQAILVTQALNQYLSLGDRGFLDTMSAAIRAKVIIAVANVIRQYHDAGLQHGCLYPKHIFINRDVVNGNPVEVRLIDLEKAKVISWWSGGIFRDIDSLNRRAYDWNAKDRLRFLARYCRGDKKQMRLLMKKLN